MKYITTILCTLFISACGTSNTNETEAIWDYSSQRLVIEYFDGFSPDPSARYKKYDYVRDSLPTEAIESLTEIGVTGEGLTCFSDINYYRVTITADSGLESEYVSNNAACNDLEAKSFVDFGEINALVSVLNTN